MSAARSRRRGHAQNANSNATNHVKGYTHAPSTSVKGAVMRAYVGIAHGRERELVPVGSRSTRDWDAMWNRRHVGSHVGSCSGVADTNAQKGATGDHVWRPVGLWWSSLADVEVQRKRLGLCVFQIHLAPHVTHFG